MPTWMMPLCLLLAIEGSARAATGATPVAPSERIQVTATRVPEDVEPVPASITILDGKTLRARGVVDLAGALALVAGVSIAPGGDAGPAASVPEFWGLREFDAFLLVVDGVPWGGAFNPALSSISLEGIDRIEVERGPAPVLYGATSFVGVIHLIHAAADEGERTVRVTGGSYGSGGIATTIPLGALGEFQHSLNADLLRQGFRDDRTEIGRGHVLYRLARPGPQGRLHFDLDGNFLRQDPASPRPRVGTTLSPLVPVDSNQNPSDARLDEDRLHLAGGYDRKLDRGSWAVTMALTQTTQRVARGFLTDPSGGSPDAEGFTQDRSILDLYLDSHLAFRPRPSLQLVAGIDHLYGRLTQNGEIFDYFVPLDGSNPPALGDLTPKETFDMRDRRNFSGLYLQAEWTPVARFRAEIGARLNHTEERRHTPDQVPDTDSRTVTRGSGLAGISWLAWNNGGHAVWLFGDVRNTFKPAAIDLGPDSDAEILDPETAVTYEVGVKGWRPGNRLAWQLSLFDVDFSNLVVPQDVGGLPGLVNAGAERFRGVEAEASVALPFDLHLQASYSFHDAKFKDFVQDFGGVPTQLEGNRLEMSARHLASLGLVRSSTRGFLGSVSANYVGSRFLNKRNTALAKPYTAVDAGVGYRFPGFELRVTGRNLGNTRPPVAESEIGDAQYYLLPSRTFEVVWARRF